MKEMKISYIANARIPTEKAHGIQIMNMCESFAERGVNLNLIIPKRKDNSLEHDPYSFYDIKKNFKIRQIWAPNTVGHFSPIGYIFHTIIFTLNALVNTARGSICYVRSEYVGAICALFGRKVVWEVHDGYWNIASRYLIKHAQLMIPTSKGILNFYKGKTALSIPVHLAPNGVSQKTFNIHVSKEVARRELNLPIEKKLALYTGHLYDWKGVRILAQSAKYLKNNVDIIFIGGTKLDIQAFRNQYSNQENIKILGQKPHASIPMYLRAADVLILPNSGKERASSDFTSPIKLFEYMASQRPIVATNLPSIREIINEDSAYLVKSDSSRDLARGIINALNDKKGAERRVKEALRIVSNYTWQARADKILTKIKEIDLREKRGKC